MQGQLQESDSQAHLKAGGEGWHHGELTLCTVHVNASLFQAALDVCRVSSRNLTAKLISKLVEVDGIMVN